MLLTEVMMTVDGPRVLEYSARSGDPAIQAMMMLLAPDCDLAAILLACCRWTVDSVSLPLLSGFPPNVVAAADGHLATYPTVDTMTLTIRPKSRSTHP